MTRYLAVSCLCLGVAVAQPTVQAPRAGCLRGVDGALRPVQGIAGALLAGAPAQSGVIAAACSDSLALVKTASALEVRDGTLALLARWDSPAGTALFALPRGAETGFAYYPATGELVQVSAQAAPRVVTTAQALGGNVLAMASPDSSHLVAVVADTSAPRLVQISSDGAIESQVPFNDPIPLALLGDGTLIFADGAALVIRPPGPAVQRFSPPAGRAPRVPPLTARPASTERRLELPAAALAIDQMSGAWLAVRLADGSAPLAMRLEGASERTCRIPTLEAAQ
jgi:hypothetical protein